MYALPFAGREKPVPPSEVGKLQERSVHPLVRQEKKCFKRGELSGSLDTDHCFIYIYAEI